MTDFQFRWAVALICGAGLLVSISARSAEYQAHPISIYDGDTGWFMINGKRDKVRFSNFDTPEINRNAKCQKEHDLGIQARDFAREFVKDGVNLHVDDKRPRDRMKPSRLLATVSNQHGKDLGEALIENGLAVRWAGKRHQGWCN